MMKHCDIKIKFCTNVCGGSSSPGGIKIYTGNIYYDRQYFNKFALLADTAIQVQVNLL